MPVFKNLSEFTCALDSGEGLHAGSVFLIPQRGLSGGGLQVMRQLRQNLLRKAGQWCWPDTGVYFLKDFARVLTGAKESERTLTSLERLLWIREQSPELTDAEILLRLQAIENLRGLGLQLDDWRQVLFEVESALSQVNADTAPDSAVFGDISEISEGILNFLNLQGRAEFERRQESEWSSLPAAIAFLNSGEELGIRQILKYPPTWPLPRLEIFILQACELYPQESALVKALELYFAKNSQRGEVHTVTAPGEAGQDLKVLMGKMPSESLAQARPQSLLFWAFDSPLPSSPQAGELLSSYLDTPADLVAINPNEDSRAKERESLELSLTLYLDWLALGKVRPHPFLRRTDIQTFLKKIYFGAPQNLETLEKGALPGACAKVLSQFDLGSEASLKNFLDEAFAQGLPVLRERIKVLFALRELDAQDELPFAPAELPLTAAVLPLTDAPLLATPGAYFWGSAEFILKDTDPASPSKSPLPRTLITAIEHLNVAVPDPVRERKLRRQAFEAQLQAGHLKMIALGPRSLKASLRPAPHLTLAQPPPSPIKLSASTLESYFRCPFNYFTSRILGLEEEGERDSQRINALAKGEWVHLALESYFTRSKAVPANELNNYFLTQLTGTLEETFGASSSVTYKKILSLQAALLAEQLSRYILNFESLVQAHFPARRFLTEVEINQIWHGHTFRGTIDRIDILENNELLLWDYKTGNVPTTKPSTTVKSGRVQWFLYRELLQNLDPAHGERLNILPGARVVGGGYLNPLRLDRSILLAETGSSLARLVPAFTDMNMRAFLYDDKDLEFIQTEMKSIVNEVALGISTGDISPRPRKETECARCGSKGLCLRPHLIEGLG